jgi:CO dehydrogenase/acetyl-CoA synthase delta subunit
MTKKEQQLAQVHTDLNDTLSIINMIREWMYDDFANAKQVEQIKKLVRTFNKDLATIGLVSTGEYKPISEE